MLGFERDNQPIQVQNTNKQMDRKPSNDDEEDEDERKRTNQVARTENTSISTVFIGLD